MTNRSLFLVLAALATVLVAYSSPRDSDPDVDRTAAREGRQVAPRVSWHPERPGEGRLFLLRVTESVDAPLIGVHGSVAGEELHFVRRDGGRFETIAAIPVGSGQGADVALRVVYESGVEERSTHRVPATPGSYRHEELSVAPRFGSPLNAADQAQLDRDRAMAREAARAAHRTPMVMGDRVVMPRDASVTSGFGDGRVFNGQLSSRHMGLDLQGRAGDTVYAATLGIVTVVAPFLLAGNVVYLNHGAGILSGYFHLSEQLVSVGDTVEAGAPVGLVGATGRVTGPHLHWVVRYGQTSVDPRSLLEIAAAGR